MGWSGLSLVSQTLHLRCFDPSLATRLALYSRRSSPGFSAMLEYVGLSWRCGAAAYPRTAIVQLCADLLVARTSWLRMLSTTFGVSWQLLIVLPDHLNVAFILSWVTVHKNIIFYLFTRGPSQNENREMTPYLAYAMS